MDLDEARLVLRDHWPLIFGDMHRCSCGGAWPCAERLAAEPHATPVTLCRAWPWTKATVT